MPPRSFDHGEGVVSLAPRPASVRVLNYRSPRGDASTTILREWKPGDASRCRLCDRCTARGDSCLIAVPGTLGRPEAEMFSTVGRRNQATVRPRVLSV